MTQRTLLLRILGVVAVAFGLVTLGAGANVLFGDGSTHRGAVVPFVVWFNFLAGFAYVAAGIGMLRRERWGERTALGLALATLVVFAAFGVHVARGGDYATSTIGALSLRAGFWIAAAWAARVAIRRRGSGGLDRNATSGGLR